MADTKLSALTELAATPANDDEVYIRDVSEAASAESKRITVTNLMAAAGAGATIVRKPDDQIVNNSTTLVNDEDLVIAVGVNDVWLVHIALRVISVSVDPDIDYLFTVPSGGTMQSMYVWEYNDAIAFKDLTAEQTLSVTTDERYFQTMGIYIGGGTAGNLQLQWAQHTATVENTTVKTNSLMLCQQIV